MTTKPWDPLFRENPMLVRLLGLSPLLGASGSLAIALGLGLATLVVIAISALLLAPLHGRLSRPLHLSAALLVIATTTAGVDLWLRGFYHSLHQALGLYVPLIAVNGAVLLAGTQPGTEAPARTVWNALAVGLGMLFALALLGAARELLGHGTLLRDFELLLGDRAAGWELRLLPASYAFPFWSLPAGAFIAAGLLIALQRRLLPARTETIAPAARVRVTAGIPDRPQH
jgi:electron transport complex protein RnfE